MHKLLSCLPNTYNVVEQVYIKTTPQTAVYSIQQYNPLRDYAFAVSLNIQNASKRLNCDLPIIIAIIYAQHLSVVKSSDLLSVIQSSIELLSVHYINSIFLSGWFLFQMECHQPTHSFSALTSQGSLPCSLHCRKKEEGKKNGNFFERYLEGLHYLLHSRP